MCYRDLGKNSFGHTPHPPSVSKVRVTLNFVKVATLKTEVAALSNTLSTSLPNSTVSQSGRPQIYNNHRKGFRSPLLCLFNIDY